MFVFIFFLSDNPPPYLQNKLFRLISENIGSPDIVQKKLEYPDWIATQLRGLGLAIDSADVSPKTKNMLLQIVFGYRHGLNKLVELNEDEEEETKNFLRFGHVLLYPRVLALSPENFLQHRFISEEQVELVWGNTRFKRTFKVDLAVRPTDWAKPTWSNDRLFGFEMGCGSACSVLLVLPINPTSDIRRYHSPYILFEERNLILYLDEGPILENMVTGNNRQVPIGIPCPEYFDCLSAKIVEQTLHIKITQSSGQENHSIELSPKLFPPN